jgi:hypothetical protein
MVSISPVLVQLSMSQLGTFHWPDLDLEPCFGIAKMSQRFSFELVSLQVKREGTRRVTVTLQGIGEGAKRNSTLQRSPGRNPTRPGLLLVLSASALKHPVPPISKLAHGRRPTYAISSRWLEVSLGRMLKQKG